MNQFDYWTEMCRSVPDLLSTYGDKIDDQTQGSNREFGIFRYPVIIEEADSRYSGQISRLPGLGLYKANGKPENYRQEVPDPARIHRHPVTV